MKPRVCETELMRSLSPHFANGVGNEQYVTPDEAKMLVVSGLAERASAPPQKTYAHREMLAQRPAATQPTPARFLRKKQRKG